MSVDDFIQFDVNKILEVPYSKNQHKKLVLRFSMIQSIVSSMFSSIL